MKYFPFYWGIHLHFREGNDSPLQYCCLENPIDRGAWQATVHGVAKELNMTSQLNNNNLHLSIMITYCLFTMKILEVSSLLKAY